MYDLGYFRNNIGSIAARLADRGFTIDMEAFRELDSQRRAALAESEKLKAKRNAESQEIGKLKKSGGDTAEVEQAEEHREGLPAQLLVLQPDNESETGPGVRHTRVGERNEAQGHDVSQEA